MDKAIRHYETAAMCVHVKARYNLGCMEGRARNYELAQQHMMIAAKLGHEMSLNEKRITHYPGLHLSCFSPVISTLRLLLSGQVAGGVLVAWGGLFPVAGQTVSRVGRQGGLSTSPVEPSATPPPPHALWQSCQISASGLPQSPSVNAAPTMGTIADSVRSRSSGGGKDAPPCSLPADEAKSLLDWPRIIPAIHSRNALDVGPYDEDSRRRQISRAHGVARGWREGGIASQPTQSEGVASRLARSEHPYPSTLLPRPLRPHADSSRYPKFWPAEKHLALY